MIIRILRLVLVMSLSLPVGYRQAPINLPEQSYLYYIPLVRIEILPISGGNCEVLDHSPSDGSILMKGAPFDARWAIRNTSDSMWRADSVSIRYVSGGRFHIGSDVRDIPVDIAPGGKFDFIIDMDAPNLAGSYVSNWEIVEGSTNLCSFHIAFSVR